MSALAVREPRPLAESKQSSDILAAGEPPEARGLTRDGVRLLVSRDSGNLITHAHFRHFPDYLQRGDVVVVNTSATLNASLDAWLESREGRPDEPVEIHLSTPSPEGGEDGWVVELRRRTAEGTVPLLTARAGDSLRLAGGGTATLFEPYPARLRRLRSGVRLWIARFQVAAGVPAYAEEHGAPIRYSYVKRRWPLSYYQTIFATEPGSAEMPSAGRAFSPAVVQRLELVGVKLIPLVLHTGVASLETHESPYPEQFRVPAGTAEAVNQAHEEGHRVVAVGTTVVRALETVAFPNGRITAGEGWTDLVITPERGLYAVDALLTGFHEPTSSHLAILESLAGREHIALAYQAARENQYLWHEFGDLHLIRPE
jgi:S-adenosylmethionine:tRNA ribosyltransferase-isomerase